MGSSSMFLRAARWASTMKRAEIWIHLHGLNTSTNAGLHAHAYIQGVFFLLCSDSCACVWVCHVKAHSHTDKKTHHTHLVYSDRWNCWRCCWICCAAGKHFDGSETFEEIPGKLQGEILDCIILQLWCLGIKLSLKSCF